MSDFPQMTEKEPRAAARAGPFIDSETLLRIYLALKMVLLLVFALNTRFVMDEFWTISQPVMLFEGTFDTYWPGKAVGYVLFYEIAHLIGWDSHSILISARLLTVGLVVGLLWIIYLTGRKLGFATLTSLLALGLLLSVSTFMERSFRLRSEPLAIFFAAMALYTILQGNAERARSLLIAGLFSGLAFVTTQKSIYFNVALGGGLVIDALASRQIIPGLRRGALLVTGWLVAVLAYGVGFGGSNFLAVLESLVTGPLDLALDGGTYYEGLHNFILQTFNRNTLAWSVLFLGLYMALRRCGTQGPYRIAVLHTTFVTAFVFLHNQTWPYVFTMALPFLVLFGAEAIMKLASHGRNSKIVAVCLCIAIFLGSVPRSIQYLAHDNKRQLQVVSSAEARLASDDTYFDGIGMIPSRKMEPLAFLGAIHIRRALATGPEGELPTALRGQKRPKIIIETYRTDRMAAILGESFHENYKRVDDHILERDDAGSASPNPNRPPLFQGVYSD